MDYVSDEEKGEGMSFKQVEYQLYLYGRNREKMVRVDYLPVIPRIGEDMYFPFYQEYLKTSNFYVDDIIHYFEGNKQYVLISLISGSFSLYWKLRKDKALEIGEIDRQEASEFNDFSLKRKLLFERREVKI